MFKAFTRHTASGVRSYSSQAARAQSIASSVVNQGSALVRSGIYYTKVAGELAKYVWVKEGLSPPTQAELQKTFTTDLRALYQRALQASREPNAVVEKVRGFKSGDYIRGSAVVLQILGLFALGEIIGRRHVYGYKDHSGH